MESVKMRFHRHSLRNIDPISSKVYLQEINA